VNHGLGGFLQLVVEGRIRLLIFFLSLFYQFQLKMKTGKTGINSQEISFKYH